MCYDCDFRLNYQVKDKHLTNEWVKGEMASRFHYHTKRSERYLGKDNYEIFNRIEYFYKKFSGDSGLNMKLTIKDYTFKFFKENTDESPDSFEHYLMTNGVDDRGGCEFFYYYLHYFNYRWAHEDEEIKHPPGVPEGCTKIEAYIGYADIELEWLYNDMPSAVLGNLRMSGTPMKVQVLKLLIGYFSSYNLVPNINPKTRSFDKYKDMYYSKSKRILG